MKITSTLIGKKTDPEAAAPATTTGPDGSLQIKRETELNLARIMDLAVPDDSLLVLMYGSPDPDSIASAMALRELLQRTRGLTKCVFASTESLSRQQNYEFIFSMHINIQLINNVDAASYRLIALVDAQPSFLGEILNGLQPQIVFDHHPREGEWYAPVEDIRPNYGALSTIMTEYLLCANIRIPRILHTALLYGIKTDTDNFDRDTISEDISAYTYHTKYANMQLIRRIELNQTPGRFLKYFDHAFHHMINFRGRRVCFLGKVESSDVCVQVADFYLRLIGTYYVVVAGIVDNRLIITFRGDGYRQNCGTLAQKAFGLYGNGGGHRSAARMEIPLEVLQKRLNISLSQQDIDRFLIENLGRGQKPKPEPVQAESPATGKEN
jgi:nanoRNase/pAp phosphatase (c-di-AMP/oligoRNAs hydrolase)